VRAGALLFAIVVAAGLVFSAPYVGQVRAWIRQSFPGHFVLVIGVIIAIGAAAALLAAFVRIRGRRMVRYGAIGLALVVAVAYSAYRAGPNPESNAVERFHFLQYGLITFLFYRAWRPLGDAGAVLLPVLAGLIVGTVEEWFQWFIPVRVGEMNDVFLNLVAIGTGLLFSVAVEPPQTFRWTMTSSSRRLVTTLSVATLLAFAAFIHIVHLGYRVYDADAGTFASRYTRERLLALQADRTAAWTLTPPPTKVIRLSREDQYLTEGIQHVRERNEKWTEGDIAAAWMENLILERFFHPVLVTATHEGPPHAWPPEQRADAQSRAAGANPGAYVSDAYPSRIFSWSKAFFWMAVLIVAIAVLVAGRERSKVDRALVG
jgi:VanZ family protein